MSAKSYADYAFYKNEYYGDAIAESDFDKWSAKASRQIDVYTSRRLLSAYPADDEYADEQIKLCVCELAEKMADVDRYQRAQAVKVDGSIGVVQSKSAGAESISFATGETIYTKIVNNPQALQDYYYIVVKNYLADIAGSDGICLLYRGL